MNNAHAHLYSIDNWMACPINQQPVNVNPALPVGQYVNFTNSDYWFKHDIIHQAVQISVIPKLPMPCGALKYAAFVLAKKAGVICFEFDMQKCPAEHQQIVQAFLNALPFPASYSVDGEKIHVFGAVSAESESLLDAYVGKWRMDVFGCINVYRSDHYVIPTDDLLPGKEHHTVNGEDVTRWVVELLEEHARRVPGKYAKYDPGFTDFEYAVHPKEPRTAEKAFEKLQGMHTYGKGVDKLMTDRGEALKRHQGKFYKADMALAGAIAAVTYDPYKFVYIFSQSALYDGKRLDSLEPNEHSRKGYTEEEYIRTYLLPTFRTAVNNKIRDTGKGAR